MRPTSKIRKVPLSGGRVELRRYQDGKLVEVRRRQHPGNAPGRAGEISNYHQRMQRLGNAERLG